MLWFLLSCVIGYEEDNNHRAFTLEQSYAAHHYKFGKALSSSLKILTVDSEGREAGHGSGNYFKIGKHRFIITAAHVVKDDLILMAIDENSLVPMKAIHVDVENDIAILVPLMPMKTKPINYILNDDLDILGLSVVYAGYPSDLNKSVFHGNVSSYTKRSFLMQSFALPGASGSVIFDNKGHVIGVLTAVKLGMYDFSLVPQLHPGLVQVMRLREYNRHRIEEIIVQWQNSN